MRKVFIVGNLTSDPVQNQVGDRSVVNVTVAVNQIKKDEPADFFRLSIWNRATSDFALTYLKKGDKVAASGDLRVGTYVDKSGATQVSLSVFVDTLTSMGRGTGAGAPAGQAAGGGAPAGFVAVTDDDLPF